MTGFIQITDTHVVRKGTLVCGRSDTNQALARTIETINARLPLMPDITCAIVTGDLTDHGTPEEYAHFRELMHPLQLPWRAIPGNHDTRDAMRIALAAEPWMPRHGPVQWQQDFGPFRLIGLDTLLEGAHHGHLSREGLDFASAGLAEADGAPVIIVTHHPWMQSGIPAMDADNLRNGDVLLRKLDDYPGAAQMISGHVHRAITGQVGRTPCQIAPATCHAVHLDHRPGHDPGMTLEPGAFTVHRWVGAAQGRLISCIVPVGAFPGPWDFTD